MPSEELVPFILLLLTKRHSKLVAVIQLSLPKFQHGFVTVKSYLPLLGFHHCLHHLSCSSSLQSHLLVTELSVALVKAEE